MSTWYYVDHEQTRQGPVPAEQLALAYSRGQLTRDSLVWRDGLAQWSPLGEHARELGIGEGVAAMAPPPHGAPEPLLGPVDRTDVVHAGFLRRLVAVVIDWILVGGVYYIALMVLAIVAAVVMSSRAGQSDEDAMILMALLTLVYPLLSLAYFVVMESSRHQATVGKMAMGIKVTDLEGNRLGFGRALGRWMASLLSYLTLYIGFFMAGFTQRKQALHDLVAGTLVVDKWAYTDQPGRQQRELNGCLIAAVIGGGALLLISVLAILAAISLPAYQDYVTRSKVALVMIEANDAKRQVSEFVLNTDRCPRDAAELGLATPATPGLRDLEVLPLGDGVCVIELTLGGLSGAPRLEDARITLRREADGTWACSSDSTEQKYLPADCR